MLVLFRTLLPRYYRKSVFLSSLIILFFYIGSLYLNYRYNKSEEYQFFIDNYLSVGDSQPFSSIRNGFLKNDSSSRENVQLCQLPIQISPFDSSLAGYLESQPDRITCSHEDTSHSLRSTVLESGILKQNDPTDNCYYRYIFKNPKDDSFPIYGERKLLDPQKGLKLKFRENYLLTECEREGKNLHYWFDPTVTKDKFSKTPGQNLQRKNSKKDRENRKKPSVLILVIESLSRLNYLRYLNRTKKFLEQKFGNIFYLEGLNKMADNSFPNMVPLLTGKRLYFGELDQESNGPYDHWPFVWKNFSSKNYLTALIEDHPEFTLFNYGSKGFVKGKPTDYYPRPFWIDLYTDYSQFMLKLFPFNIDPCWKNRWPKIDLFFKQVGHFIRQCYLHSIPFFAFAFYIEMTHNNFNKAKTADWHLEQFLQRSSQNLNDTIFILMGDHGNRFGPVLQTKIGRIEERMPFFAIHLPKKLTIDHPNLARNLRLNRERLTTWLDINQMLMDIVDENFEDKTNISNVPKDKNSVISRKSFSPWREEIPLKRTCQQALIPDIYCACDSRIALDIKKDIVKIASKALVDHLNAMIEKFPGCQQWTINKTLSAELIMPSSSTVTAKNFRQQIELIIRVDPEAKGIFRGRLYRMAKNCQSWSVDEEMVTRINEYGNQSLCIDQRKLKPFCYCHNLQSTLTNQTKNLFIY